MDETESQEILLEILHAAVNELESSPDLAKRIISENLASVFRLAKKHNLAHIVSNSIYRNKIEIEDEALRTELQKEELLSVYQCERMRVSYEQICSIFEEAGISYIPLKGAIIRAYYPYEYMRTSCDIDILIREEDLDCAINCLTKSGFLCGKRHYHDVSLYSPQKIHLELHFNIQENIDSLDVVLKDAWKYASQTQGSRYDFSKAFFVFHMYAHMAYHFLSGGCGIRSLMDIWIMEHKMKAHYSCAEDLLKKAGIYTFACEMSSIANQCFTYNERDGFADQVLRYIYSGRAYGTKNNKLAVQKTNTKNSFMYACKRLFLPYRTMITLYPTLKRISFLLPFYWLVRCVSAVFKGKTKKMAQELSRVHNISDNTVSELTEMRTRLGI